MTDATPALQLPDRLSVDPRSPHHVAAIFEFDVEEYCISEGWIRVPVGKTVDRKGKPLTVKLKGAVEAFLKPAPAAPLA